MTPETDDAVPPWEMPGAVRRDCEPHRATTLHALALAGFGLSMFGCLIVPALMGLPLSVAAGILARRDLAAMASGKMDASGAEHTENVTMVARSGMILAITWLAVPMLWLLLFVLPGAILTIVNR
jgi:hypothetical protein